MLLSGKTAPDFTLPNEEGNIENVDKIFNVYFTAHKK